PPQSAGPAAPPVRSQRTSATFVSTVAPIIAATGPMGRSRPSVQWPTATVISCPTTPPQRSRVSHGRLTAARASWLASCFWAPGGATGRVGPGPITTRSFRVGPMGATVLGSRSTVHPHGEGPHGGGEDWPGHDGRFLWRSGARLLVAGARNATRRGARGGC